MTLHTALRNDYWARFGHVMLSSLLVLASVNVDAQALYGSLVGNVVDESGAVVRAPRSPSRTKKQIRRVSSRRR